LLLVPGRQDVHLRVSGGGGLAAIRTIEAAYEVGGGRPQLQRDALLRELRITLGQLPADLRGSLKRMLICGKGESARELFEELRAVSESWGMTAEWMREFPATGVGARLPA